MYQGHLQVRTRPPPPSPLLLLLLPLLFPSQTTSVHFGRTSRSIVKGLTCDHWSTQMSHPTVRGKERFASHVTGGNRNTETPLVSLDAGCDVTQFDVSFHPTDTLSDTTQLRLRQTRQTSQRTGGGSTDSPSASVPPHSRSSSPMDPVCCKSATRLCNRTPDSIVKSIKEQT